VQTDGLGGGKPLLRAVPQRVVPRLDGGEVAEDARVDPGAIERRGEYLHDGERIRTKRGIEIEDDGLQTVGRARLNGATPSSILGGTIERQISFRS